MTGPRALVQTNDYRRWDGTDAERMSLHTHLTTEAIDNAVIDTPTLIFDNLFDQMEEACRRLSKRVVPGAIYRLSIEVDVEDHTH